MKTKLLLTGLFILLLTGCTVYDCHNSTGGLVPMYTYQDLSGPITHLVFPGDDTFEAEISNGVVITKNGYGDAKKFTCKEKKK